MSHEPDNAVAGPSGSSSLPPAHEAARPPSGSPPPSPPSALVPPSLQRSATGDEVLACPSLPAEGDDDEPEGAPSADVPADFVDREDDHANRVSMYVRAFEEMLNVVLAEESYLFSELELATFARYRALSYNARYLLTRLMLRKPRVYRKAHLERSYAGELGRHVGAAMDELCAVARPPARSTGALSVPPGPAPTTAGGAGKMNGVDKGKGKEVGNGAPSAKRKAQADVIDLLSSDNDEQIEVVSASTSASSSSSKRGGMPSKVKRTSVAPSATKPLVADLKGKGKAPALPPTPPGQSLSADVVRALSVADTPLDVGWFCAGVDEREGEERLLRSLQMDEVRDVARGMKCWKAGLTYDALVETVLKAARSQTTLAFPVLAAPADALKQGTLPFGGAAPVKRTDTGRGRLIQVVKDVMGQAIIVNPDVRLLWGRLNLVFYRSTMTPPTLLLPQILTNAQKRHYPVYPFARTLSLFPSRGALLAYERALLLETEVDDALGEQETLNGRRPFSKAQEGRVGFGSGLGRREGAEVVRAIWELVWDRWTDVVRRAQKGGKERKGARTVADRFQPGHVLTRIVYKGAFALGILHDYDEECVVLRALLAQKVWRRGKRGAWYERLALILMTHYKGPQQEDKRREALDVCIDGLEDDDTHLIYRPSLARRLARLENFLSLPYKERHICDGALTEAETVTLSAVRLRSAAAAGDEGCDGGEDDEREGSVFGGGHGGGGGWGEGGGGWGGGAGRKKATDGATTWGAKSAWLGRDGGEVGVEQWVLEQWEDKGWKGFHAEGSIVTTVFGLLFWDVFFADVPGVFETPYQSAPLDLGEDTFALARSDLVKQRLADIAAGKAPAILAEVDARERDKGTLCVGVRWEFGADDLREIVECLGGPSLEVVCRMLSEEYGHRSSGVPDLLVWNYEERRTRFVEVKGPGDRLSSTQQVWLDVLIGAGVEAEVCKVVEAGNEGRSMSRSASPAKRRLPSPDWPEGMQDDEEETDDRPVNLKKRRSVGPA